MKLKIAALGMAVIAVSAIIGASAYTTGSVSRSTSIDVVTDDKGLIALADGTSGGLVTMSSGKLNIDFTQGGASGVNPDATYKLGNPNDATNQSAFNISNLDANSHSMTIEYTGVDSAATGDGTANIEFRIYDSSGTKVATVSEESTSATISGVSSGSTLYVVIVIDTTGLTDATSLSGTLKVSV
ncbi:MAG: hypothetical protein ABEI06_09875 [Halobacteriaceae archaeon]